jgi:ribonuclease HI
MAMRSASGCARESSVSRPFPPGSIARGRWAALFLCKSDTPHMSDTLEAYTDGSCLSHPRRGGIGVHFVYADPGTGSELTEDISPPGYPAATNQEMEILACTTALKEAYKTRWPVPFRRLILRTDSTYVQENYKRAIHEWPKNRWMRRDGGPVENAVDWKDLVKWFKKAAEKFHVIRIEWVEGHAANPHNKAAHRLAQASARSPLNKPRKVIHVRRKHTTEMVERGSVRMTGQRLTIHVIQSGWLKLQNVWRCKYEVMSAESPFLGKVDIIFADPANRLDAGHTYEVIVNSHQAYPRVVHVARELQPPCDPSESPPAQDQEPAVPPKL